jgi:hypothetical protein
MHPIANGGSSNLYKIPANHGCLPSKLVEDQGTDMEVFHREGATPSSSRPATPGNAYKPQDKAATRVHENYAAIIQLKNEPGESYHDKNIPRTAAGTKDMSPQMAAATDLFERNLQALHASQPAANFFDNEYGMHLRQEGDRMVVNAPPDGHGQRFAVGDNVTVGTPRGVIVPGTRIALHSHPHSKNDPNMDFPSWEDHTVAHGYNTNALRTDRQQFPIESAMYQPATGRWVGYDGTMPETGKGGLKNPEYFELRNPYKSNGAASTSVDNLDSARIPAPIPGASK